MQRTSRMLTPQEALDIILAHVQRLPSEEVGLMDAAGRVLAEPLYAPEDHPPFPAATMDGYAVIHDDTSPWREVIGEQFAGHVTDVTVTPGTAVRITTGAPLPAGADAVVPVEDVELVDDHIVIRREEVRPGENVRPVGADVHRGELIVPAGTVLGPAEIGLAASLGIASVPVSRRPRVSVLSTGDELVDPGQPLGPGQIRDSNRFMLVAALQQAGAEVVWAGRGPDDVERLTELLRERIAESDVVISSGGVSVGERDLISAALRTLGTVHIERLFMKPGKPFHFVTVGRTLLFGLPGNPVSALVGFEIFVMAALRAMTGQQPVVPEPVTVVLAHPIEPGDRIEYQRAIVWCDETGTLFARNTGPQSSARLLSAVGANAYLIVPPRAEPYRPGERLRAILRRPVHGQAR
ncbi:MAG: molybdopterin molybdotransferase MoeA [Thermomicrobium sp.]|jgi:molybdenum cofactor synthesis domain-containing protein|uniref:molybdopterin molybdotransferase MoeA n=1 Tax=Thermomicrobium sp. TaxID=1969469 RepID=UPI001AFEF68F|nr:gephyrin-like molybdotransferase Glp [Thermomicrobium sp.]MBO9359174.1 molybdopterin molybdotransferase MoeA [Thermomicrobium sp.]MBO9385507.1 molybdopterin molybdotransferase MoeA [Thermomicrobium sp.]